MVDEQTDTALLDSGSLLLNSDFICSFSQSEGRVVLFVGL